MEGRERRKEADLIQCTNALDGFFGLLHSLSFLLPHPPPVPPTLAPLRVAKAERGAALGGGGTGMSGVPGDGFGKRTETKMRLTKVPHFLSFFSLFSFPPTLPSPAGGCASGGRGRCTAARATRKKARVSLTRLDESRKLDKYRFSRLQSWLSILLCCACGTFKQLMLLVPYQDRVP